MKTKLKEQENLREIISEKYDSELNIYKLITFEAILLKSKMLSKYCYRLLNDYSKISFSIKKTKEKIENMCKML